MYPVCDGARTASQAHARLPRSRQVVARSPRTATPGCGTHSTLWRAQSRHALHSETATPSRRHRQAPSQSCRHLVCTTTHSPSRLISPSPPLLFLFPTSPSPFVVAPPASPFPPFVFFCGHTLVMRGPLPRQRVWARPRPTAPTGDRVSVKPRAVPLLLGPPAGLLQWPPRQVGGLHCVFSLDTPTVDARGTVTNRPLGQVGLGGAAGCVSFLRPTAGCARRRHAKRAGVTVRFSLATPPVGAFETSADCPRGRARCCGTADCVSLSWANRWD